MKEHYVTYEQAFKLKELGFDEPCEFYYNPCQELRISKDCLLSSKITNNHFLEEIADGMATAPRLDQETAWLRDVKRIYVEPYFVYETKFEVYIKRQKGSIFIRTERQFDSYEEGLSFGIDEALELLRKEVNNA